MDTGHVSDVFQAMFRPGKAKLRKALDSAVDPEVVVTSPFFEIRGKEGLYNILRAVEILVDDKIDVKLVAPDKDGAIVYHVHRLTPRLLPILEVKIPLHGIVKFKGNRIIAIHEHVSLYTITWNVPVLGWIWERYLKHIAGVGYSFAGAGLDFALQHAITAFDLKGAADI